MAEIQLPKPPEFKAFDEPEDERPQRQPASSGLVSPAGPAAPTVVRRSSVKPGEFKRPLQTVVNPDTRALQVLAQLYDSPILKAFIAAGQRRVF